MNTGKQGLVEGKRRPVEILDCTLREGGYAVDFQYSEETIERVLVELENAGVRMIELGHGWGLNGESVARPGLVSDARYFEIARRTLTSASWGAICVPGIAHLDHLRAAVDTGLSFIRVGTNITQLHTAPPFVKLAKERGLMTTLNLMKTQVLDDDEVIKVVRRCEDLGADIVYIVDSFGSLLPERAARLVEDARHEVSVPIGFHGHDNLGLAHANSLAAFQAGASYIDTTLDGLGRSAGNATTEGVSTLLRKLDIGEGYDSYRLSQASEDLIQPLDRITDSRYFQLVGAFTDLHSSSFPMFQQIAKEEDVPVATLMERVSIIDRVTPSPELVRREAVALRAGA
jgi:4-hydroxy 2-oxovalerate aldolase